MRALSALPLLVLFIAGCTSSSPVAVGDVGNAAKDGTSHGDGSQGDAGIDKDGTTPDAASKDTPDLRVPEVTDPCAPPAASLCPCSEGGDCMSGLCKLHLGEKLCTDTCEEECPAGWDCVPSGAGGPDAVHVCLSLYPSLCIPCSNSDDCTGGRPVLRPRPSRRCVLLTLVRRGSGLPGGFFMLGSGDHRGNERPSLHSL